MRVRVPFLCVLWCIALNGCSAFRLIDIGDEMFQATTGVLQSIPRVIPSPTQFFSMSKNIIFGLPFDITFNLINNFCTAALNSRTISVKPKYTPDIKSLTFILRTRKENITIPLTNPDELWNHASFDLNLPLVIFVTGWKTDLKEKVSTAQETLAAAYLCRGNVNFVTVDTAAYIDTLYSWSAFNTEHIGQYIGEALQKLIQKYPLENIHLIGHSLGAQICGAASRHFNQTTKLLIPRITGLDPANPCFSTGETLSGLFRGDAQWVDVIHTNPGCLGKKDSIGDCDFFCNGVKPLQPDCFDIVCSHKRAWEYYAESVWPGNEENFLAKQCSSMQALQRGYCNGSFVAMGYATPNNLKGNYFLKTNGKRPYGENSRKYYQPICAD